MAENAISGYIENIPDRFRKAAAKMNSMIGFLQPSIGISGVDVVDGRIYEGDPVRIKAEHRAIEGVRLQFIARRAGEESFDIVVSMLFADDLFPTKDPKFRLEFPTWGHRTPITFAGDNGRAYTGFETYFGTQEEIDPMQAAGLIREYLGVAANYYGL